MTVCVLGLGHIGLPTALLLSQNRRVIGVDVDENVVSTLESGDLPFEEPKMPELFGAVEDQFSARTSVPTAEEADRLGVDTYVVATPTPLDKVTQVADLRYVQSAMNTVAASLTRGDLVVLESTVPPGTTEQLVLPILKQSDAGKRFDYAYCPERAIPGNTIDEMVHNDRVVGGLGEDSRDRVVDLYEFVEGTIHTTTPTTGEFVKLIENTYRDVNIALANELGRIAEQYGIDGRAAIGMANNHPRVDILSPGPGVGGHCLPVDPQFLAQSSTESRLVSLAREINDGMPVHVLRLVRAMVDGRPGMRITVLGVAYKGNVDDTRETPALKLLRLANNEGYDVSAHDPYVDQFDYELEAVDSAIEGSDCLIVVADHDEYEDLDPTAIAERMRTPNVLDTRDVLDFDEWEAAGFAVNRLGDGS